VCRFRVQDSIIADKDGGERGGRGEERGGRGSHPLCRACLERADFANIAPGELVWVTLFAERNIVASS
jgi:hypothetical protein